MQLVGNQTRIKQDIINYFNNHHNASFWLAGEPGVGKTYITSSFVHDYLVSHPHHNILVISPANVMKKWAEILHGFNPDTKITKLTKNNAFDRPATAISLLSQQQLNWLDRLDNKNYHLVIYDEFHEVAPVYSYSTLKRYPASYQHIAQFLKRENDSQQATAYHPNFLALSGTVFNQEVYGLLALIKMTNPKEYAYYASHCSSDFRINEFTNKLWQYISTTINLSNVKANLQKLEIEQTIMPIQLTQLSQEERAFYQFTCYRLQQIKPTKASDIAAELLDFPSQNQFVDKRSHKIHHLKPYSDDGLYGTTEEIRLTQDALFFHHTVGEVDRLNRKNTYIAALTLNDITLTNTHKFEQLKKIIQDNSGQSILVLLNGNNNLKRLQKAVRQMTDRDVNILSPSTAPTKRAETINSYLNSAPDNIMIANANSIKTGIDLNSVNVIVWYQLLNNMSDILQTQRRAQRLNSQQNSKVYYLAYADTAQEDLVNQLSKSNTRNASAYGTRASDALSQLQGILFKDFTKEGE